MTRKHIPIGSDVELEALIEADAGGGSAPGGWKGPYVIYANKWSTIDPTQNTPGFEVPDAGTFKLSYGAEETAAINFDATAADVLAALDALPTLTGKIALDPDDHTGLGPGAGPLPTAPVNFVLDDSLAPQLPIVLSDNSLTVASAPISPWPTGVTHGLILTDLGFTPSVADVIEDFLRENIELNDGALASGPQEVFLTDGTLSNIINDSIPTFWVAPASSVIDLNDGVAQFTNFSGSTAGGTPNSARDADVINSGAPFALPARCLVSVPLRFYFRSIGQPPSPGGIYRMQVKVGHVEAP